MEFHELHIQTFILQIHEIVLHIEFKILVIFMLNYSTNVFKPIVWAIIILSYIIYIYVGFGGLDINLCAVWYIIN